MIQEAFASENAYTDTSVLGLMSDVTGTGKAIYLLSRQVTETPYCMYRQINLKTLAFFYYLSKFDFNC